MHLSLQTEMFCSLGVNPKPVPRSVSSTPPPNPEESCAPELIGKTALFVSTLDICAAISSKDGASLDQPLEGSHTLTFQLPAGTSPNSHETSEALHESTLHSRLDPGVTALPIATNPEAMLPKWDPSMPSKRLPFGESFEMVG
jgi:hypothetical protein